MDPLQCGCRQNDSWKPLIKTPVQLSPSINILWSEKLEKVIWIKDQKQKKNVLMDFFYYKHTAFHFIYLNTSIIVC